MITAVVYMRAMKRFSVAGGETWYWSVLVIFLQNDGTVNTDGSLM